MVVAENETTTQHGIVKAKSGIVLACALRLNFYVGGQKEDNFGILKSQVVEIQPLGLFDW